MRRIDEAECVKNLMGSSNGRGEEELSKMAELSKTLKEGERILAPTRRPDGTLRKPIRIRAGYVPQDEVAIYQSKGALEVPPGYDPVIDSKSKTKSIKRNERKKEKRLQAALEKGKKLEATEDGEKNKEEVKLAENISHGLEYVKSLTSQMNELCVSANAVLGIPPSDTKDPLDTVTPSQDIDKRIRTLKKKIRLAEAQQQKTGQREMKPEQLEKLSKVEGWKEELKHLEDKKGEVVAS
ncbi:partner of Y14 and mago isoform X2 [Mangifera indica]|uniref:partner of Y14 and mago isoform X2 n=1 Tax=Mangifera indica TaxID=29780 RepID=UPI001CF9F684|nr:partner of Y14 and mago isoform X2 [Mangifera indica]